MSQKQHGGKRPGAGRPANNPEGATMLVSVTVPQALIAKLDELAGQKQWNRSQAVTEAIRRLVRTASRR